jgi:hypothetical protein
MDKDDFLSNKYHQIEQVAVVGGPTVTSAVIECQFFNVMTSHVLNNIRCHLVSFKLMSFHVLSCYHFMSFHVSLDFSDQLVIKSGGEGKQGQGESNMSSSDLWRKFSCQAEAKNNLC